MSKDKIVCFKLLLPAANNFSMLEIMIFLLNNDFLSFICFNDFKFREIKVFEGSFIKFVTQLSNYTKV